MSQFFIERPIFAWVIAIIIMLAGVSAIIFLPIEQYPNVAPPSVVINATYPGADAKTVEDSVTQVLEQNLTGIDNLRYMQSQSYDASAAITLTFNTGTDPDIAQVQTQNKVQLALAQLPIAVQAQGIAVQKSNDSFLLVVGFYSKDGSVSQEILGDIVASDIKDPVARINGVGNVNVFGEQRAMRIWLNPDKLVNYHLTATDVNNAITEQNINVSAGQLGGMPAVPGQALTATITAQSLYNTVEQFENILLRVQEDGSQVRLKDVARVSLGSQSYEYIVHYNKLPASGMGINLATGANALTTASAIKAKVAELAINLPHNIEVVYPYDTTPFIKLSIHNVVVTLLEAFVLVFLVMLLFLQNLRVTIIPTIVIPIVLLGTFAVMYINGFTINVLTMFAMVLAIGLLVDDAIVVVENIERLMTKEGLDPKAAAKKSMQQITGALIGITLVLSAVFVPMAFFTGSIGVIYRQFSLTIVAAMLLSIFMALIFSPALSAVILKPVSDKPTRLKRFFYYFNLGFDKTLQFYINGSKYIINHFKSFIVVYFILIIVLVGFFSFLATSFLPDEDQGSMYLMLNTPPGTTAQNTMKSVNQMENYLLDKEKSVVDGLFTVVGYSFAGLAQNTAMGFADLKPWDDRNNKDSTVFALANRANMFLATLPNAIGFAFFPPPINSLGQASGFDLELVDRASLGHSALMQARNQLLGMAAQVPYLTAVRPNGLNDVAQYKINIDSEQAKSMGITIAAINNTLETAWGSSYVNNFLNNGRIKRVMVQSDAPYRMLPNDVDKWYVRNLSNEMVPFSAFTNGKWSFGSPKLERFNGESSIEIQGAPAPGISTGQAMKVMLELAKKLPFGFDINWVGLSYEEVASGSQTHILYGLSVLIIFLFLAALYESWSIPFTILFAIPLGVLGTILATYLAGLDNDVYFQVALLTTIGLSAKNAILIVEFAKDLQHEGQSAVDAAINAAKLRFRPIIMTSMAFILGVTPLALSTGAGSASQNAIGFGVIGGMIASTTIAIFFVPMFYVLIQKMKRTKESYNTNATAHK